MKIYELTQKGEFHVNYNEDYKIVEEAGLNYLLIAVLDGCSSGTDSHFASSLIGKLLRKLAKQEAYEEFATQQTKSIDQILKSLSINLFKELKNPNANLDLDKDELLSTILMGIINTASYEAEFLISGDGVIHVDGQTYEFENENKPNYIGYHIHGEAQDWLTNQTERLYIHKFYDLSISTDGIHTFKNFDGKAYPSFQNSEIEHAFFSSRDFEENSNKLKKTYIHLSKNYGLLPSDDLTMIRVIV